MRYKVNKQQYHSPRKSGLREQPFWLVVIIVIALVCIGLTYCDKESHTPGKDDYVRATRFIPYETEAHIYQDELLSKCFSYSCKIHLPQYGYTVTVLVAYMGE